MASLKVIWDLVSNIVVGGLGLGAIVWIIAKLFGKNLLDMWFQKQIKRYEAELERATNELSEKLRVEYGSLFKHRIDTIKDIYALLADIDVYIKDIEDEIGRYKSDGYSHYKGSKYLQGQAERLMQTLNQIDVRFSKSKIYFSKEDEEVIMQIITIGSHFNEKYVDFIEHLFGESDGEIRLGIEYFIEQNFTMLGENDFGKIKEQVKNRFRELVGVKTQKMI